MKRTYKFRIYPTRETEKQTNIVLELCRQIYNLCLEQRRDTWKNLQKSVTRFDQIYQLPDLKKEYPEFTQIPSQTLYNVVDRVNLAFQVFFRRIKQEQNPGYPRFKSFGRYDSFTLTQAGWKIQRSNLFIKKIGKFKVKFHRQIEGTIKTVTISKSQSGKWFVCFSCDNVSEKKLPAIHKSIGIDVGCESFLTDSNGFKVENPRFLKHSEDRFKVLQQKMSKQSLKSNRRKKTKQLIARVFEKITNQRLDFHHKVAKHYVDNYYTICHEKMNAFTSFRNLNRSMRDVAWFQFFNILHYKAEEAGREVIEVPAKDTSQRCSGCGEIVPKSLGIRVHNCPHCHTLLDRDFNSALNILRLGASRQGKSNSPVDSPCKILIF
jgi:putative transposase